MAEAGKEKGGRNGFGPVFSRLYSLFVSKSRKSAKAYDYISDDIIRRGGKRVLDVGCGPGILLSVLIRKSPGMQLFGTDPSDSMLSIARRRLEKHVQSGEIAFRKGDSTHIPFDGEFDMIISTMSFHHWEKKDESIDYIVDRLAHGGSLVVYERYRYDEGEDPSGKMRHSMSKKEADALPVFGTAKAVKVEEGIISVTFTKIA